MGISLPQSYKTVEILAPATDAAGRTGAYVSLKNCRKAFIAFHVTQGNAATILISLLQATTVAGGGSKVTTVASPIWSNLDEAATDTLVRRTDAVNYTTDAGVKHKFVLFEIDPGLHMDTTNSFDCLTISTGASNAGNITEARAWLEMDYEQATPPSAILD
jgi:hypothetical protein